MAAVSTSYLPQNQLLDMIAIMRNLVFWLNLPGILLFCSTEVDSANILMSGFLGEGSHFLCLVPIGKSLVKQGHNVTFLISEEYSHRADDPELSELFNFEIFTNAPDFSSRAYFQEMAELGFSDDGGVVAFSKSFASYTQLLTKTCDSVLGNKEMMKRFESLDAIVSDAGWPCGAVIKLYLAKHRNRSDLRLILNNPTAPHVMVFDLAGSPYNPSYQPSTMSGLSSSMTFLERTQNVISVLFLRMFVGFVAKDFKKIFYKYDLQEYANDDIIFNKINDLVLATGDFSVEYPFPRTPNIIMVGGLTSRPAQPLNEVLEEFMQSSGENGVVLFCLGTYFSSFTSKRPALLRMIVDAFSRIPQKVIMQLKELPNFPLPANVKALAWIPQNDLLGHPKTRLFMYHGGNNGFYEAIYHGVPLIVIPFLGDQIDVATRVVSREIGLSLDKHSLSTDYIHQHLTEVLNNSTYSKNVKRFSAIFKDRPMTPADRAAFWVNHVIKHGGEYMRMPYYELSFIQYHLIDVIIFLTVVLAVVLYVVYRLLKLIIRCCGCRKTSKNKQD